MDAKQKANCSGHLLPHVQRGKADLQLACERKIIHADVDENAKLLLINSVKSYAALSPAQQQEYRKKLEQEQNREVKETSMTWLDKERAKERRRVLKEVQKSGQERELKIWRQWIGKQWTKRFGPVPEDVANRLEPISKPGQLERILDAILDARDQAEAVVQIANLCPTP